MKRATVSGRRARTRSFSLLEVVIALGVITVGIVGILAVFPTALQTGHSAQDETRAAHIAQSVFGSLVAEGRTGTGNLNTAATIPPTTTSVNLTSSSQYTTCANNDGQLINCTSDATYAITIFTNNTPPGFTSSGDANQVTVRVAWPASAPAANQTFRDYVRIVSKY
jgi:uncharacterized protein (TIGR02598 family)